MLQFLKRRGLRTVLLAQVVLPVLIAVALLFFGATYVAERLVEQRMKEDIELVARAIRLPVGYSLRAGEPINLMTALESIFEIGRVYGARVYKADGHQVAAAGMADLDRQEYMDIDAILSKYASDNPREGGGGYARIEGVRTYAFFMPLLGPDGERAGLLQVTRRFSDFTGYMQSLRVRALVVFGLVMALIVGLILTSHHYAIGRPLHRLVESMNRVKRGDLAHRARVTGPRELASLGTAFNDMLDGVERTRTELVHRERAERALTERLREAEKMAAVGRLSSGIAHELGTPLSVVDGRARRIERSGDGTHTSDLQVIRNEVQRMSGIVNQLLDFGRDRESVHRRVDLDRVCRSAFGGIRDIAGDKAVTPEYVTDGDDFVVTGDALRLEQAVSNMLRNAVQAAPGGSVRLTLVAAPDAVAVRVADSGPGIPDDRTERVFEPFYTTREIGEGTGLGLSVVRGVADEHRASIMVDRDPALGGARFLFMLPRQGKQPENEH